MRLLKNIYQNNIRALDLSKKQLETLKGRLLPNKVCYGPFIKDGKMCPTTTALSIKIRDRKFRDNSEIKIILRKSGIKKINLWIFYILFDIPSMLSERFFKNALNDLKEVINELIREKRFK